MTSEYKGLILGPRKEKESPFSIAKCSDSQKKSGGQWVRQIHFEMSHRF